MLKICAYAASFEETRNNKLISNIPEGLTCVHTLNFEPNLQRKSTGRAGNCSAIKSTRHSERAFNLKKTPLTSRSIFLGEEFAYATPSYTRARGKSGS